MKNCDNNNSECQYIVYVKRIILSLDFIKKSALHIHVTVLNEYVFHIGIANFKSIQLLLLLLLCMQNKFYVHFNIIYIYNFLIYRHYPTSL